MITMVKVLGIQNRNTRLSTRFLPSWSLYLSGKLMQTRCFNSLRVHPHNPFSPRWRSSLPSRSAGEWAAQLDAGLHGAGAQPQKNHSWIFSFLSGGPPLGI